jgi:hypothetical protein
MECPAIARLGGGEVCRWVWPADCVVDVRELASGGPAGVSLLASGRGEHVLRDAESVGVTSDGTMYIVDI